MRLVDRDRQRRSGSPRSGRFKGKCDVIPRPLEFEVKQSGRVLFHGHGLLTLTVATVRHLRESLALVTLDRPRLTALLRGEDPGPPIGKATGLRHESPDVVPRGKEFL